jgi:hypothetical protein
VATDFIDGLPSSNGYSVIMVVVDKFSKYAHFFPLKHPYTAPSIVAVFLDNVAKLHGMPKTITSDRDKVFTTTFWKALFQKLDVKLQFSLAYHSQTDSQIERVNQCLEMYLKFDISSTPKLRAKWLPLAELWYNSAYHASLKCSPFKALYGVEPSLPAMISMDGNADMPSLEERQQFSALLRDQLDRAQNKMKVQVDSKR